jgi:hypothetical protein
MQMSKKLKWGLAALIVLSVAFVAQATVLQNYYLPLVYRQKPTPTPTPKTQCLSGKNSGVCVTELKYKGGIDEEVISIKNLSSSVDMKDWRITSDSGNKFDITFDFTLAKGATVKVWTKGGTNNSTNIYMNWPTEFWNDSKDCAWIKIPAESETVDGLCYGISGLFFEPVQ